MVPTEERTSPHAEHHQTARAVCVRGCLERKVPFLCCLTPQVCLQRRRQRPAAHRTSERRRGRVESQQTHIRGHLCAPRGHPWARESAMVPCGCARWGRDPGAGRCGRGEQAGRCAVPQLCERAESGEPNSSAGEDMACIVHPRIARGACDRVHVVTWRHCCAIRNLWGSLRG